MAHRASDPRPSETRHSQPRSPEPRSLALTALAGAAAGVAGVWLMDRLDWFLTERMTDADRQRTHDARPDGEPPAEHLVSRAADALGRDPSPETHHTASVATHYLIGVAPAIAYALFRDALPLSGPARGAGYGAALWALQDEGLNSLTGLSGAPGDYPWQDHPRGLAAHILFGVATDAALDALERGAETLSARGATMAEA